MENEDGETGAAKEVGEEFMIMVGAGEGARKVERNWEKSGVGVSGGDWETPRVGRGEGLEEQSVSRLKVRVKSKTLAWPLLQFQLGWGLAP